MSTAIPDAADTARPPRRRRWIPLSLRLFVAIVVVPGCVSLICIGVPAYRQLSAIREIERLGGHVQTRPQVTGWLRSLVGDAGMKAFDEVLGVHLSMTQATDGTLLAISPLRSIQILGLNNTQVTDAGLVHLKGMTNLVQLNLGRTRVTNAGLANLNRLPNLRILWLDNTQVDDAGLEHLEGLTGLQVLVLHGTQVTDAGLEHLKKLTHLESLALGRTQVTHAGLLAFKRAMLPQHLSTRR